MQFERQSQPTENAGIHESLHREFFANLRVFHEDKKDENFWVVGLSGLDGLEAILIYLQ